MPFDSERARRARIANPRLTRFDTGESLEPQLHIVEGRKTGSVDFDNSEGGTALIVSAFPDNTHDADVLNVSTGVASRVIVVVDGKTVYDSDKR
jgi:hypothetical protein